MSRVAVATCAGDDVDVDSPLLMGALAVLSLEGELCVWDDPRVAWNDFDLVVIRSTWDYASRRDEYLRWARGVDRLANPYPVVEYSTDKHYLVDLASRGVEVVATSIVDVGQSPVWPEGDFVVKPCVGAGSIDARRYAPSERDEALAHVARLHGMSRDVIVQPYVASVDQHGERALIFLDGVFSHAMTKGAMLNVAAPRRDALYRREQMSRATPEPDAVAFAQDLFELLDARELLYARVDLVRDARGWALMELELAEPSLFLTHCAEAATALARAIARRVG